MYHPVDIPTSSPREQGDSGVRVTYQVDVILIRRDVILPVRLESWSLDSHSVVA